MIRSAERSQQRPKDSIQMAPPLWELRPFHIPSPLGLEQPRDGGIILTAFSPFYAVGERRLGEANAELGRT